MSHPSCTKSSKTLFIMSLNVAGALHNPKNMTIGSNNPNSVMNAALCWLPSFIQILLYPVQTSNFVKIVAFVS